MYTHHASTKRLQAPREVKSAAQNSSCKHKLVLWVMNQLWIHIIDFDSLQEVMFRSTSGSIVANRCQEGKRIHSTNPHPVIFHDYLTPVAAGNLSTLRLKEPVVIQGINSAIFQTCCHEMTLRLIENIYFALWSPFRIFILWSSTMFGEYCKFNLLFRNQK